MIPFARNPHFVGRQKEIQELEDKIFVPDGPRKLAITGLGGVGKTQIALELAYLMRDREPECSIFWIPCTSYEAVEQSCMSIAQLVGLHDVEPAEVKQRLQAYLSQTNEKWILIFDNADEFEMWTKGSSIAPPLRDIIPWSENGHVLFTSRNRQLALKLAGSNVVSVPDVDQKTGKEIFWKLLIRKDLLQDDHVTNALLERLAFLPLAISQAAAYINQNGISLARYMSLLGEQEASIIELLGKDFDDDARYGEIQNPVATTWLVSFMQIQRVDQIASDYLSFMACINPRDIPESILPATTSATQRVEALGLLKAYSFLSAQVDDSIFSLHRLVHLTTRNWLRKRESLESWVEKAADQLDKIFPDNNHNNQQLWRSYLPHALYLASSAEFQAHQDKNDKFLERLGKCLQSDGRYAEAETLLRNVLQMRERALGPEDRVTLTSFSQLASVLDAQGRYEEAEVMHQQALHGYQKVLDPEHPISLAILSQLALTLARQGKYEKAEALHQQALRVYKKVLGMEHPHTLTSVSQLGLVLTQQGKYEEAEAMQRLALQGREKVLGPEHPDTLMSVTHLGWVLDNQGKYKEAGTMHQQAFQGYKKVFGLEHPGIFSSVSHLGLSLARQGRYEEAEAMLRQGVQGREEVLGLEHPDTLTSLTQLGLVLENQGKYREAEIVQRRAFYGREKSLGPEHPDTLMSASLLGLVLTRQGKYEEAEAMHRLALKGREKVLGPEHPVTLMNVSQLGLVLAQQGKYEESEAMHQQALRSHEKVLGVEHPDTLASVGKLSLVLAQQGKYKEAETMQRRASQGREKVLGPEHPDTLTSFSQLGSMLAQQGKYKEAETMLRQALHGHRKVLGPEHPITLTSVSNLGLVLDDQGKYEEAEAMYRQTVKGREEVLGPKHPDTLTSVSQLGSILERQGKYVEAEAMHRWNLAESEKVLGPEHPDTLISVSKLGSVLDDQGKYEEAEAMYRRTVEGREKLLGPENPATIISVSQLGFVLARQSKYEEAHAMLRRALESREQRLGPRHPDTLTRMDNMASAYWNPRRWNEVEELEMRVKSLSRALQGWKHTYSSTSHKATTVLAQFVAYAGNAVQKLHQIWRPKLREGYDRVTWTSAKGKPMYIDVKTSKPGAAQRLQDRFRNRAGNTGYPQSDNPSVSPPGEAQCVSTLVVPKGENADPESQRDDAPTLLGLNESAIAPSPSADRRYLLLCFSSLRTKSFRQIDITNLDNDQYLFDRISDEYKALRADPDFTKQLPWLSWFSSFLGDLSMFTPKQADLVSVSIQIPNHRHSPDVRKTKDDQFTLMPIRKVPRPYGIESSLPPEEEVRQKRNWHYHPCPQEIERFVIDDAFITQLLEPGHAFLDNAWIELFPKKLKSELRYEPGRKPKVWGIHIVEGINVAVVTWLGLLIFVLSGGVGVVYAAVSGDPGTGFTISAFLATAMVLVVTHIHLRSS
jgi:tetratricopeptide (TPR) repeat protein